MDIVNRDQTIEGFARSGWAIVDGLLAPQQIARARRAVQWSLEQPWPESRWIRPRSYECFQEHPIYVELIEHPFVIEFADRWLGPDFHVIAAQCSRNTRDAFYAPGADALHQDAVFFPRPERRVEGLADDRYSFSAMWYLQDTPLEMGPTELVSGSHLSTDPNLGGSVPAPPVFRQPMPAGSLLLFNHRTWHRGTPNNTARVRDLITNAYANRAIEKVQLTTPQPGRPQTYVPCQALLDISSDTIRQLLAEPVAVG